MQGKLDPLTGLGSRAAWRTDLCREFGLGLPLRERPATYANRFLCVDLENFKHYDDTYGHEASDRQIERLSRCLRSGYDGNRIYRYGGEEFVIELREAPLHPSDEFLEWTRTAPRIKYSLVEFELILEPKRLAHFVRYVEMQIDRGMVEGTPAGNRLTLAYSLPKW